MEENIRRLVDNLQQRISDVQKGKDKYVAEAQRNIGSGLDVAQIMQQKDPARFFNVLYNVPKIHRTRGRSVWGGQIIRNTVSKRMLDRIAPEYLVRIFARKIDVGSSGPTLVDLIAILQEEISLRVETNWQSFIPSKYEPRPEWQAIAQMVGGTLITRWTTRRVWMGTEPIEINMKLRFEADEDAYNEVVVPCLSLKKLGLPSQGPKVNLSGPAGMLSTIPANVLWPPGPNPIIRGGIFGYAGGENIEIQVGLGARPFLYFNSVVMKRINVTYANRFTTEGYPVSASVDVTFQTYATLTKDDLEDVFSGKRKIEVSKTA
jgi:hypothetical protein